MLEWKKRDENIYEHVVKEGEPNYGTLMYAFGRDTKLINPEITSLKGSEAILYSNDKEYQGMFNARPIDSMKEFVEELTLDSAGVADYVYNGKNRRIAFCLDREKSLKTCTYVVMASFIPFNESDRPTDEIIPAAEVNEILERISTNAMAFKTFAC